MGLSVSEEESVKRSECNLSCWLVLPAARKRRERQNRTCLSCSKGLRGRGWKNVTSLLIVARVTSPGRMAWYILIGRKYEFGTKTVKIFLRQIIIWTSFCYNLKLARVLKVIEHGSDSGIDRRGRSSSKASRGVKSCYIIDWWYLLLAVSVVIKLSHDH